MAQANQRDIAVEGACHLIDAQARHRDAVAVSGGELDDVANRGGRLLGGAKARRGSVRKR